MQTFATDIPISRERTLSDLLEVCKIWILGSPHTCLREDDFKNLGESEDWTCTKDDEIITFSKSSLEETEIGGLRYFKRETTGLEWTTEIVGAKTTDSFWVSIRVSCESSVPSVRLPDPRKPYIIRQLINSLGCDKDGDLEISDKPRMLENREIDFAGALILGKSKNHLPIVYVSADFDNEPLVNPRDLAQKLSGMAHVVVEPNRAFSLRLMIEVDHINVYGGAVGIYWPDGAGRRSYYLGPQYYKEPRDIEKAVIDEVRVALANRRPLKNCTWSFLREALSKNTYRRLKQEGSTELGKYIDAFDLEIQAKDQRIQDSEKEIRRLQVEIRLLEARCTSITDRSILACGKEQDFYPGEIQDVVIEALSDARKNVKAGSRRRHILDDLLAKNKPQGEAKKIEERIKSIFKSYRTMDARCRGDLEELGFDISEEGKHYKAVFQKDGRYIFSIPKTSSDHRSGKNLASDITSSLL